MWRGRASTAAVACLLAVSACSTAGSDGPSGRASPARSASTAEPSDGVLVIAHRGASAYAPKDTIPAIRAAIRRGADVVEVDIRQTRDRALVALFDKSLAGTTNVEKVFPKREPWIVESFTLEEIRRLDAGSWFAPSFSGTKVPTLGEVIETVRRSDIGLIVEVKSPQRYPGIGGRVVRTLRSSDGLRSGGRYLEIESFDWGLMRKLNRMAPDVAIGLAGRPPPRELRRYASYADAVNPQHVSVDTAYVDRAHRAGLAVKVWSVNETAAVRRALEIGVDGIYSHKPDMVKQVLSGAGS